MIIVYISEKCPAGSESINGDKCRPCAINYYKIVEDVELCSPCPDGFSNHAIGSKQCSRKSMNAIRIEIPNQSLEKY